MQGTPLCAATERCEGESRGVVREDALRSPDEKLAPGKQLNQVDDVSSFAGDEVAVRY